VEVFAVLAELAEGVGVGGAHGTSTLRIIVYIIIIYPTIFGIL
jgi:hypothetical protein